MESPEEVLKASGEPPSLVGPPSKRQRVSPEEFVCDICCDTPPELDVYKERCGHKFCKSCWRTYIVGKVKDEGQSYVACMQEGCPTILDSNLIKDLVDPPCYERYFVLFHHLPEFPPINILASDTVHFLLSPSLRSTLIYASVPSLVVNKPYRVTEQPSLPCLLTCQ